MTVTLANGRTYETSQELWDSLRIGDVIEATVSEDGRITQAEAVPSDGTPDAKGGQGDAPSHDASEEGGEQGR